jgi:hypothetical protein
MKLSLIRYLACMILLVLLCACGGSNPFIGKWQAPGNTFVTFTKNEMTVTSPIFTQRKDILYKKEDQNWLISTDNGKHWQQTEIRDKDTIALDLGMGVKITLKRAQ